LFPRKVLRILKYKELYKKRTNAEYAAKRDLLDYDKFRSEIFALPHLK
tara:strand:- start:542 stop:685 length:144 start_codon:yes stop_codon:yes gene_type:complete